MIRTLIYALRYDPANSRAIGYYATQQNAAYNIAVDALNRQPDLPKRSGRDHPDALNRRITHWRQQNRQQTDAPYHVHQAGAEQAWEANQLMRQARADRHQRIAKAEAKGEPPKGRDIRPHRRTLKHRARKTNRLSLTITDRRLLQVSADGLTLSIRQCGLSLSLRSHHNLLGLDIRSIQLLPTERYGPRTPLERRHYCLHVQVREPDPPDTMAVDIHHPTDILGIDRGTKNHAMTSSKRRIHHEPAEKQSKRRRKRQRHIAGKPKHSKRRRQAVKHHRNCGRRYSANRDRDLRQQIQAELRAQQPKAIATENLRSTNMMASAKGAPDNPGKGVAAKTQLNASLADAALGHVATLFGQESAKLGLPAFRVPPQGTSQTCPHCGYRHRKSRESQASFRCLRCGFHAHADWTASVIIANRAFVQYCERRHGVTPGVEEAPTGWREQPSRSGNVQLGLPGLSVFKPKGNATSSDRSRVRGLRPALPYPKRQAQAHKVVDLQQTLRIA